MKKFVTLILVIGVDMRNILCYNMLGFEGVNTVWNPLRPALEKADSSAFYDGGRHSGGPAFGRAAAMLIWKTSEKQAP